MVVFQERRASKAAIWSTWLATFAAVLLVMAALSHRFGLLESTAFFAVLGVVGGLVIASLCCAGVGFSRLWHHGERGGRASTLGIILSLIVAAPFAYAAYNLAAYPRLFDISTDAIDPPAMPEAARQRTNQMNPVGPISQAAAVLQREQYPTITGRRYSVPADRVLDNVLNLMQGRGWQTYYTYPYPVFFDEVTVEARVSSLLVKLPSDVAVRVRNEGDGLAYVDMRSSTPYGLHDLGENARRINRFLLDLDGVLQSLAVPPAEESE
jgi:uncharacterized membrane protein